MRQILVAVDEGEASERVAEFVNEFFGGLDVSVTAVNVGSAPLTRGSYPAMPGMLYPWPYAAAMRTAASGASGDSLREAMQGDAEQTLAESGLGADEMIVEFGGGVAEALRRVASERDVDLLVVGSSDKGLLERLFSPSVSKELAKSAPTPVLVVH